MVYQIYYGDRQVLFDIEIYLKINEEAWDKKEHQYMTEERWYVEMHSDAFISGTVDFINIKRGSELLSPIDFKFSWEQFKKDCKELEELRGWLWETHHNSPRLHDDAGKDYNEWSEYVRNKVYTFAKKYGLSVNED